jgi:hypothetical protein
MPGPSCGVMKEAMNPWKQWLVCCEQVIDDEKLLRGAKVSVQRSRYRLRAQNRSLLRSDTSFLFRKRISGRDRTKGEGGPAFTRVMVDVWGRVSQMATAFWSEW